MFTWKNGKFLKKIIIIRKEEGENGEKFYKRTGTVCKIFS